jgi:hypothetical protein
MSSVCHGYFGMTDNTASMNLSEHSNLIRSSQVLLSHVPVPEFLPRFHYVLNDYMTLDLNITSIFTTLYLAYYFALEPVAAVSILLT